MLLYLFDALYSITIVFGCIYGLLWAFAKVMQTFEEWDRDE